MKKKILFGLMLLMMMLPMAVMGQNTTANGIIKNTKGEELIGCCIWVRGTSYGTISDLYGKYSLEDVKIGSEIGISYAGYSTQYYTLENGKTVYIYNSDDQQRGEKTK